MERIRSKLIDFLFISVLYFSFFILKVGCFFSITGSYVLRFTVGFWDTQRFLRVICVLSIIMFLSLITLITTNNYNYKKNFLLSNTNIYSFNNTCKFIFCSDVFWVQIICISFWIIILPCKLFYFDAIYGFGLTDITSKSSIFCTKLSILLITNCIIFLSHFLTINWWISLKLKRKLVCSWKHTIISIIKQSALIILAYIAASSALALVYPMLHTVWNILIKIPLIPVIFMFCILSCFLYRYLRAYFIRYRFWKKLRETCNHKGYSINYHKNIYLSIFRPNEGLNIILQKDSTVYSCKLISAHKYLTPLYFHDNGNVLYTKSYDILGIDVFHVTTSFKYFFDADQKKYLIICPIAANIYATDGMLEKKLNIEDTIMGYKIYNSSTFISAITNYCL